MKTIKSNGVGYGLIDIESDGTVSAPPVKDADQITTTSIYKGTTEEETTGYIANLPAVEDLNGFLITFAYDDSNCTQIFIAQNKDTLTANSYSYQRNCVSGTFGNWATFGKLTAVS